MSVLYVQVQLFTKCIVDLSCSAAKYCQIVSKTLSNHDRYISEHYHCTIPKMLCITCTTASKSNLFVRDDTPTEVEETNKDLSPLAIRYTYKRQGLVTYF